METIVGARQHVGRARSQPARRGESAPHRSDRRAVSSLKAERLKIVVRGAVQGVGFRPFVYRVATELKLNGYVSNTAQGLFIEVEGHRDVLEQFQRRIQTEKPPRAIVQSTSSSFLDAIGYDS